MNGAQSLLTTAHSAGVRVCFANPGTTEMPLVSAFDEVAGIRPVLGLSEGVVTGAADGYARMADGPAMTLLHLGPGFANGIANLHNARRAHSPVVNIVGEHASWHQSADPPLATDIDSLARPVSNWVGRSRSAESLAPDFAQAWFESMNGGPSTLIAASDHLWGQGGQPVDPPEAPLPPDVDAASVAEAAKILRDNGRTALLLGGSALRAEGLRHAARIAHDCGAEIFIDRGAARIDRDPSVPGPHPLPYFPEQQLEALQGFTHLILIGASTPVAFFGYPGMPSVPVPESTHVHTVVEETRGGAEGIRLLAEATESVGTPPERGRVDEVIPQDGELDPRAVATAMVATQPENAIIVNEGITAASAYSELADAAWAHTELPLTGGAIGMGIPLSVGAALACPDRPVVNLQADGSAYYTLQGLWTQAREGLNITTVLCSNRRYRILAAELQRSGVEQPGAAANSLTELGDPAPDWRALAAGFGVPAERVETGTELARALRRAHAESGPHLIEAVI